MAARRRGKFLLMGLVVLLALGLAGGYRAFLSSPRLEPLRWDVQEAAPAPEIVTTAPDDSLLIVLRREYGLDSLRADAPGDYELLQRIVHWTHQRWRHSGSHTPSRPDPLTILREAEAGARFRCVEYSIVAAACATALGLPARVLALKRRDVETAESGAGHVVVEVWLPSLRKWVFADPQWDAIPEREGVPLNAVEFRKALEDGARGLRIRSGSLSWVSGRYYLRWVGPYLFYFDFALDQRFFVERSRRVPGRLMLVPRGAKRPTVFQRKYPIANCTYISNPDVFYPAMNDSGRTSTLSVRTS